ncbi:hypothetical protein Plhal703r1_c03g0014211 [Plasmopara halstedii]
MVSSRIASPSSSSRSYESTDRNIDLSHSQYDDDDKMALSEKAATPMTSSSPKETLVRGSVEFKKTKSNPSIVQYIYPLW